MTPGVDGKFHLQLTVFCDQQVTWRGAAADVKAKYGPMMKTPPFMHDPSFNAEKKSYAEKKS